MSPLMGDARWPLASSFSASSTVSVLVRTKTITPSKSSASKMRVIASSLLVPTAFQ